MLRCFLVLVFITAGIHSLAQVSPAAPSDSIYRKSLHALGKYYGDSVVIRWAPSDAALWAAYNEAGYVIERMELTRDGSVTPARTRLTVAPLKPWTTDEWQAKARPADSMAAAAVTLLYGKSDVPAVKQNKRRKTTDVNLQQAIYSTYDKENRFSMALFIADNDPFVANGMALRFVDRNISRDRLYIYSVHALADPRKIKTDTATCLVRTNVVEPPLVMPEVRYTEGDKAVTFRWGRKYATHFFTSYHYERSEDGGKTFRRQNTRPYVQPRGADGTLEDDIVLTDSLPQNYKVYHYRIIGITPFGDLSEPTPMMAVTGRDLKPPSAAQRVTAEHLGKKHVKLTWQKPDKEPDFEGFVIGRSETLAGPFSPLNLKLLGRNTTTFTDTSAITWGTNYYVVSAIDSAGNAAISMPAYVTMIDTIPPAKPSGLHGSIDTTGIVKVQWKLGNEPDLHGYMVYFANAADHTFNPVTRDFLADSVYMDSITLNTITEKIYYRIVAFDRNRNPSQYSDILELKKPDKIPPVSPVFISFQVTDRAVALKWAPSSSGDVASQSLYRREDGKEWIEIGKLQATSGTFNDTAVAKRTWYEYGLIACDDDGNYSERSFPLRVRVYDSGFRKDVESLSASPAPDKTSISLTWRYAVKDDYYFLIYRSYNGQGMEMYQQVAGDKLSLSDNAVTSGTYDYAIKAIYRDGGQSPLTKAVRVELK